MFNRNTRLMNLDTSTEGGTAVAPAPKARKATPRATAPKGKPAKVRARATPPAAVPNNQLSEKERRVKLAGLIDDLRTAKTQGDKKVIRRKLRALGHKGGLRGVKAK